MMSRAALLLTLTTGLALGGCLGDPKLKTCAEFPAGTEGCGSACEVYCDFMVESCSEVYDSRARCLNDCANEPVTDLVAGQVGDRTGNSVECRLTFGLEGTCAEASLRNSTQCVAAQCADYCSLMLTHCAGAYPSEDNCLSTCADLPRGDTGVDANTIECRFGYAELAANDAANCDAASMAGGGVCGDPCEVYCDFLDLNCTGANAIFADRNRCISTCALLDAEGRFDDWDFSIEADTLQCRIYHAGPPAALEPDVHCNHARVYNSVHCGIDPNVGSQPADWPCGTFCDVTTEFCPGVYADFDACMTDCGTLPEVTMADPATGPAIYPVSSLDCPM